MVNLSKSILQKERTFWFILIFFGCIVYVLGAQINLMEIDAAQYGSIALEMLQNKSFLKVTYNGGDYLDKPPFLFWTSAISFAIFGINNFAYKIPSILATLLAGYSIYKFSKNYYSPLVSRNATIIYLTLQSTFLINHDVRTDTLLCAFVIYSLWQISSYLKSGKSMHLYGAALGISLAMLAKGPIGLMVPGLALFFQLGFTKNWNRLLNWHLLGSFSLCLLILFPMCYGLYHQFDLQPDKIVNGKKNISGLYFYFWEQSFGRITGQSEWKDSSGPAYFVSTWLWSFMPWLTLSALAIVRMIFGLFKRADLKQEYFSFGGIVIPFIVLSLASYKLPHYIFVTYPLLSIITASEICRIKPKSWQFKLHWGSMIIYLPLAILLAASFQLDGSFFLWALVIGVLFLIFALAKLKSNRLIIITAFISILFNIIMNGQFYPQLLKYQSSSESIAHLKSEGIKAEDVTFINIPPFGLRYYYNLPTNHIYNKPWKVDDIKTTWVIADETAKDQFLNEHVNVHIETRFNSFRVSKLNGKFLNPKTRQESLSFIYLLKLYE